MCVPCAWFMRHSSPPYKILKMAVCFATVVEEEIHQMNEETTSANTNPPVWLILKQLSPSVLVPSEVNINH